jgi:hypothetical protein
MLRTILVPALAAALLGLLNSSQAYAWGATRSVSYSGSGGYGSYSGTRTTTASGSYGSYSRNTTVSGTGAYGSYSRNTTVSGTGGYGGSYSATSTRTYSPTMYNGYSAAGVTGSAYRVGVTRYP